MYGDEIPAPERTDVSVGDYAFVMYDEGEALYQYERPVDWQDPEWILKQSFEHNEVPPLNFEQARLYREHNGSTLAVVTQYATDISSDRDTRSSSDSDEDDPSDGQSRNGYWTEISGTCIPETGAHHQQKDNMVAVVNHLIEQHNLLDHIELPYTPTWARTNCSINEVAEHPDGREMNGAEELVSGDYLFTAMNKKDKHDRIKNLANRTDVEMTLRGKWQE